MKTTDREAIIEVEKPNAVPGAVEGRKDERLSEALRKPQAAQAQIGQSLKLL